MCDLNLHASSEILNEFEWQLSRLIIMIEMMEGLATSGRDLHKALSRLLEEVQRKR
ncbi:MAG: hypothetical protein KBD90_05080 [Alphaproteobacteria bacterium]|jgi:hypothetical protein|nr:hypothetical protein [Alphaproteobacteria bacterium]